MRFSKLKISSRLFLPIIVLLAGFVIFGYFAFVSLNRIKVNGPMYARIIQNKDLIADVLPPPEYIIESYLNTFQMLDAVNAGADRETLQRLAATAAKLRADFEQRHGYWVEHLPEGQIRQTMINASYAPAIAFFDARDRDFIPAILAGDRQRAMAISRDVLRPRYDSHRAAIDALVTLAKEHAQRDERETAQQLARTAALLLLIGVLTAVFSAAFSAAVSRSITVPLSRLTHTARAITDGTLRDPVPLLPVAHDEIGVLAEAFHHMTTRLHKLIDELKQSNQQLRRENSERRQAEAALRDAQRELEQRVRERTGELQHSNAQLAAEIAERRNAETMLTLRSRELSRSNTELEQFAYIASHDLQEPLRMVTSYLQLLTKRYRDQLDADAGEFMAFAVDGTTRMRVLIDDLLAYSRIGTREQSRGAVDCEALLTTVLGNLRLAIAESNATITRQPLPMVTGDPSQLLQVFQNLIANAIKFHGARRPEIDVGVETLPDGWRFTVQDNGIGIDPQHFDRIFLVFQRLHGRTSYPGTGIGLAICKKIIERHGGIITVTSQPGHGTTFAFTLPAGEPASNGN